MIAITYLQGDATAPRTDGNQIIAHICNDIGRWGKGFVLAVSHRWPLPEVRYRQWYQERAQTDFGLGEIQLVQVESELWVCNMIAQHGVGIQNNLPPIRYDAVEQCLSKLAQEALKLQATVHMPRIGCGLAGGKWEQIEPILIKIFGQAGVHVFVYDFV